MIGQKEKSRNESSSEVHKVGLEEMVGIPESSSVTPVNGDRVSCITRSSLANARTSINDSRRVVLLACFYRFGDIQKMTTQSLSL